MTTPTLSREVVRNKDGAILGVKDVIPPGQYLLTQDELNAVVAREIAKYRTTIEAALTKSFSAEVDKTIRQTTALVTRAINEEWTKRLNAATRAGLVTCSEPGGWEKALIRVASRRVA